MAVKSIWRDYTQAFQVRANLTRGYLGVRLTLLKPKASDLATCPFGNLVKDEFAKSGFVQVREGQGNLEIGKRISR